MQADTIRQWVDQVAVRFGSSVLELETMARSRLQEFASSLLRGSVIAAGAATSGILQAIVCVGALFVFLTRGAALYSQTVDHSPLGRERTETLLDTVREMIQASFFGVVAVAAVQGTLLGIGLWIAGIPAPAVWGIVGAVLSVLPILGTALVWVPAAIVLLTQGNVGLGIFLLVWGGVVVANSDNVVRPLIVMKGASMQLNGLAVFIALLGAVQAFGLVGIFVGPVTLALGLALLRMLREEVQAAGIAD
jgi:predicted PurR-regulated permease PerM